jgi:hypothetical protein
VPDDVGIRQVELTTEPSDYWRVLAAFDGSARLDLLQPGRHTLVRGGHADAKNIVKHLQNGTVTGRAGTGRNRRSATLDQLVLVRIQVRQVPESPYLRDFLSLSCFLDLRRPSYLDQLSNLRTFVRGEVVHNHYLCRLQCGVQNLFYVGLIDNLCGCALYRQRRSHPLNTAIRRTIPEFESLYVP